MNRYRIVIHKKALKKLKEISMRIRRKIINVINALESTPIPWKKWDIRKLSGLENFYRIRIGAYRIIYHVNWKDKIIVILKIEKRNESTYKL